MTPEIDTWEYRAAIARNHDWLNGHHCPCDCCAVVLPKIAPPVKSTRVGAMDPPSGPCTPAPTSHTARYGEPHKCLDCPATVTARSPRCPKCRNTHHNQINREHQRKFAAKPGPEAA